MKATATPADGAELTTAEIPAHPANAITSRLWRPAAIVFISNTCIMVLELVAGRIVAPYVGVSLYTWTSVIGVVLAGISLGNYIGGWLADRWASLRLLGGIFVLAGLFAFVVIAAEGLGSRLPNWPVIFQILLLTTVLFFVPSMILGGVSPIVAKLAVRDLNRTGSTLGGIYAAGTVGSIVGTFATGFFLISWLGTHVIVWGVAIILLLLGAALIIADTKKPHWSDYASVFMVILSFGAFTVSRGAWSTICTRETNYFCIRIQETEIGDEKMLTLILDRLVHSYTYPSDPTRLHYVYERIFAEATAYQAQRRPQPSALFIGGGGYTFPRYMEAVYPGSTLHVVEIDPGVTDVAHDYLGLPRDTSIVSFNEDARLFVARPPEHAYDLIYGDAFNDYSVPYHLTTKEFNDRVRAWLAPDGLYLVNLIDGPRHDFLRAFIHTLRQTFAHVYLTPGAADWREAQRQTYVLIASNQPLDMAAFKTIDGGDGVVLIGDMALSDQDLNTFLAAGRAVLLTDRFAPVDQMLAPVVRNEEKQR